MERTRSPARPQRGVPSAELAVLAREQAALRRVATLVAREASPGEVFDVVAQEVAGSLDIPMISVVKYRTDGSATQVGAWGAANPFPVGLSWTLDGTGVAAMVAETARPARLSDYGEVPGGIATVLAREAGIRSAVGVPIVVSGAVWGVMLAMWTRIGAPADVEDRLAGFTELVATAIANAQARDDLHRLVDEQSALRRVATAVAGAATPEQIFDLVCRETGRLFVADTVNLVHFTPDGVNLTMAGWSSRGVHMPMGTRLPLDGAINELVRRTSAPGRFDTYGGAPGQLAQRLRGLGIRSEVGAPVVVGGHVWGALIAGTDQPVPLPVGTEDRLARFAELIGTAVGNAADRAELVASRARIVAAGDAARLRLARDLHDGAQQRLVSVVMSLQLADQQRDDPAALQRLLTGALDNARAGIADLRELAAGMHPAILTDRGLRAAARSVADRCAVPVTVTASEERFAPLVEVAAYFVIAEALTNIDKHASASRADVRVSREQDVVTVTVDDDGVGGATFAAARGLLGLRDRVEALGGTLVLDSNPGQGTHLRATLPAGDQNPR
jgi:signal transduction histidine kinase